MTTHERKAVPHLMSKAKIFTHVGVIVISPTLDKLLAVDCGDDIFTVPNGEIKRGETIQHAANRCLLEMCGIRLVENDFMTHEPIELGTSVFVVAMSSKKPTGEWASSYVPWRFVEESCEEFLLSPLQKAKEIFYS